jgi:hypothetical protein
MISPLRIFHLATKCLDFLATKNTKNHEKNYTPDPVFLCIFVFLVAISPSWAVSQYLTAGAIEAGRFNQPSAASFMILTIVFSTSCATPFSWGVLNIPDRGVGFNVANMGLLLSL